MSAIQYTNSQAHAILDDLSNGLGYLGADNTRTSRGGFAGKILHDLGVKFKGETHIQAFKEGKVQDFTKLMQWTKKDLSDGKISPQEAVEDAKEALQLLHRDLKAYRHEGAGVTHSEKKDFLGSETNGSSARFTTYNKFLVTPVKTPKAPGSLENIIKDKLANLGVVLDSKENVEPIEGESKIIEE